jgi:hypothetical protein
LEGRSSVHILVDTVAVTGLEDVICNITGSGANCSNIGLTATGIILDYRSYRYADCGEVLTAVLYLACCGGCGGAGIPGCTEHQISNGIIRDVTGTVRLPRSSVYTLRTTSKDIVL